MLNSASYRPPAGPAIHPVFDGVVDEWANPLPARGASVPTPVVFLGHFNDQRAAGCRPADQGACRQRFVVDQVPWVNGIAYDAVFPATADGIPTWTVEQTLRLRDAGDLAGLEVAIRGWYGESTSIALHCAAPPPTWGVLEPWCTGGQQFLTDIPQLVDTGTPPTGTAITPAFVPPYWAGTTVPSRPDTTPLGGLTPTREVLVGHFDDPQAVNCPNLGAAVCRDMFVLDRVAWLDGKPVDPVTAQTSLLDGTAPEMSAADVSNLVANRLGGAAILSLTLVSGPDIPSIDPTFPFDQTNLSIAWYVRAVQDGTHEIGSFVVDDASGTITWSAFPLPVIPIDGKR